MDLSQLVRFLATTLSRVIGLRNLLHLTVAVSDVAPVQKEDLHQGMSKPALIRHELRRKA